MIVHASDEKFKQECDKNACTVIINLHNRYLYDITVTPMGSHVVLSYKTLQYKVPRADKEAYTDTIDFLAEAIDDAYCAAVNEDINEYWHDDGDDSEEQHYCTVRVTRQGAQVFSSNFQREDLQKVLKRYLSTLRLLD